MYPQQQLLLLPILAKKIYLIEQANPTCGCTISDYTKAPIAPGKTGVIHATYNAANLGQINKTLTVKFAGADDIKFIKLSGEVLDPATYDKAKPVAALIRPIHYRNPLLQKSKK